MTTERALGPSERVQDYTSRFGRFLSEQVEPLEAELGAKGLGTVWAPVLDEKGRMHPEVWQARR
ncbi:acyl-CoA dehydrogenase, partial [Pseudonocardia sp. KRD-291]|nr:acyl-CoA dehydrogenase [Pseudonocardia sp. KRD291]